MSSNIVIFFVVELILLYLLALGLYYFFLLNRRIKINDRLGKFTIYKQENKVKVFDNIFELSDRLIKYISKLLYKLKLFNNYSSRYQKYIKDNKVDKMDFVSRKIIYSFLFVLSVLIYNIFTIQAINIFQILLAIVIGFYILDIFLVSETKLLKKEKENDLLRAITIMNNSFKSGHSIMQGIKIVSDELNSPLGLEFKKMYVDLTYGLSIDIAFERFEHRVNMEEVKYITTSLKILNDTGGDIVKVFESVEKTFFNNKKLNDELRNLTASSRFLYYVLLFIPIAFIIIIYILDNTYFTPLFINKLGYLIVFISLILYISYIFIVRKIMKMGDIYD